MSESEQAGMLSMEKLVGRTSDDLVGLDCNPVLLIGRVMHVRDESLDVVYDSLQVVLVLGF
jgi:hypothetical protein